MFDSHYHLGVSTLGALATSERDEWPCLKKHPDIVSVGLLQPPTPTDVQSIEILLKENPRYQIGEVGLDKRKPEREKQLLFLRQMLALSERYQRVITLHNVQCDNMVLNTLTGRFPAIWHGCTASVETIREAVKKNCIPSFGPNIYRTKLFRRIDEVLSLPFLLESDCGDPESYPAVWQNHVQRFSALVPDLEERVAGTLSLIGWDRLLESDRS